jgi:hypothetical protein
MNNIVNNQAMELIKDGTKGLPGWANVLIGLGLAAIPIFCSYMEINHKAKKQQETNKKKSDLRKEEFSHNSALRTQELKEKTAQAIDLDDRKTDNKIRIIQAKGEEDRKKAMLKHDLSQKKASEVEDVTFEPTSPVSTFNLGAGDARFYDGPSFKIGGLNIVAGVPGTGKSSIVTQFMFHQCGMNIPGLFETDSPENITTGYLYDYELGKGFYSRYRNLVPRNFHHCDMEEKNQANNYNGVVYTLGYLYKQIQEDLEYPSGNVIIAIDCKGKIVDVKGKEQEFVNRLKQFIHAYKEKTGYELTVILVEHLNPAQSKVSSTLCVAQIKGSQDYNSFADQTVLVGQSRVKGCVRIKVAKNRWGEEQVSTIHLFKRYDKVFFEYIGEYDEEQVVKAKGNDFVALDKFRSSVKPTSTPTYNVHSQCNSAGRPTLLTKPICMAILNKRSQGMSKNEASASEGFTRQAYNEALVRYGLIDNYPPGKWKP